MKPVSFSKKKQSGVVLIVSLLLLLVMAIIATATSETNILQLQMSGNDQSKAEGMQQAFAIVDAILDERSNTAVIGDVGYTLCKNGLSSVTGCDEYLISIDSDIEDSDAVISYSVTRVGPEVTSTPYLDEESVSSSASFEVARQEIFVSYDRSADRLGKVEMVQGVLRLIPKLGQ